MVKQKDKLKIIPLGGVGEIGKNMTILEYNDDIVVIDCGVFFPDDDMPGIDVVMPDMSYLEQNRSKLRGYLITHGHEDHIGALPYALKRCKAPVYGTNFTIALIEHKLNEAHVSGCELCCVKPSDCIELGCFKIEFIKTSHSIAGAVALAVRTPIGTVIHTGDFKIDLTPIDGEPIDINRFAYYGTKGVLALMSDSTNIERAGYTQSEREIGKTFEHYFDIAQGRVIVASFASNVYRLQQVADVAIEHGRVICFQGRSMEQTVEIAQKLGYLNIPKDKIVRVEQLAKIKDDKVCVMTTGSQGEHMSGLFRMANDSHRLNIGKKDMVIISASAIPGNEIGVGRVINALFAKGAHVVYDRMADVHVSGHACKEELRLMMNICKPRYFIPVHGEYRHLFMHSALAKEMGIPEDKIFVPQLGETIELTARKASVGEHVASGSVMVDGLTNIEDVVVKDRKLLSSDGVVSAVITIDSETGRRIAPIHLVSRGFVYNMEADELFNNAVKVLEPVTAKLEGADKSQYAAIKNEIRAKLKSFLQSKTKRFPVIIITITEI
ncbi:MAG TPA: ribonuclease J [Clostridia bacterium]|nr:ribonuclease J [Clostridia bacterium]